MARTALSDCELREKIVKRVMKIKSPKMPGIQKFSIFQPIYDAENNLLRAKIYFVP